LEQTTLEGGMCGWRLALEGCKIVHSPAAGWQCGLMAPTKWLSAHRGTLLWATLQGSRQLAAVRVGRLQQRG
jgi:hypothetical protein